MIKYFHFNNTENGIGGRKPSFTAGIQPPTKEEILQIVAAYLQAPTVKVAVLFGLTKLHPQDRYVKALGREMVLKNMKDTLLTIAKVEVSNKCVYIKFELERDFQIIFRLNKTTGHATAVCYHIMDY